MSWLTNLRRPSLVRRVVVACVLAAGLLLVPLPASGGILWDIGIGVGYGALVFAITLYLYPLRGEGLPHKRLFTLSQHRRLGWIALILGALHGAILLLAQPLVGHYLLPSAPLYMLLGLAALIVLAVLVTTGLQARSALRNASPARTSPRTPASVRTPPFSVSTHAILAALLVGFIAAHIIGSAQLIDSAIKSAALCLLLALPLLWASLRVTFLRPRVHKGGLQIAPRPRGPIRLLPTALPSCAAAVTLVLLPIPTATPHLLQPALTPSILPVQFPHEKHTKVNCVICHHNFVDKTGIGSCLDCHRSARPDLTQSAEATFHVFCRGCHTELAQTTTRHGPTRSCSACHAKDSPLPLSSNATQWFARPGLPQDRVEQHGALRNATAR
jgi:Class III cytochrome C family